jgi:acyl-CoA synthetase (AMP-forming)/AMP-acid ligase II
VLHAHPSVVEAAVVAKPHPRLGEGVCAFVVPAPGEALGAASLLDFVARSGLARQKIPERVEFRDSLAKTPTGKIRKDLLRAELGSLQQAGLIK